MLLLRSLKRLILMKIQTLQPKKISFDDMNN